MRIADITLTFCISLILNSILVSCGTEDSKKASDPQPEHSATQYYLLRLVDDYKAEYAAADSATRESVRDKYLERMRHFLVDSLGRKIDSMTVYVDSIVQNGWQVTTQFHTGAISFKYGMTFKDSMPAKFDSLYRFMIGLSPGEQVMIDFMHIGAGELYDPTDSVGTIMKIFAYPVPLTMGKFDPPVGAK